MGSMLKGSGLFLAKRGCDEITSSFVVLRINLLPSISLTRADGGMASAGSELLSSFDHQPLPYWSIMRRGNKTVQP